MSARLSIPTRHFNPSLLGGRGRQLQSPQSQLANDGPKNPDMGDQEHSHEGTPSQTMREGPLQTDMCHPVTDDEGEQENDEQVEMSRERVQLDKNTTPVQELWYWHTRLGHLPFPQLQEMARNGDIPARLASCRVPKCTSCAFGKATKVPWRTKGKRPGLKSATKPGQCVSMDQLDVVHLGLIGLTKGNPTVHRY